MNVRIGYGFDVHQLKDDVDFFLGGVKIEHTNQNSLFGKIENNKNMEAA